MALRAAARELRRVPGRAPFLGGWVCAPCCVSGADQLGEDCMGVQWSGMHDGCTHKGALWSDSIVG